MRGGWRRSRPADRRRLLTTALVSPLLAVALVGGAAPATYAQSSAPSSTGVDTDLDAIIAQVRDELGESSEAMVRAAADLRLADAALPGARETAAHARALLATATRRQEETANLRGQAQVQLVLSTQEAEASAPAVAEQQTRIGRLAREAYQSSGSLSGLSVLLEARSPADFAERLASLQTLASSQRSVLDDLATVQESYGSQVEGLEQVRDSLATADEQAQRELAAVRILESTARASEETVSRLVATRAAALEAARAAQAADDAATARRQSVSGELQARLAARARAEAGAAGEQDGTSVAPVRGTLAWPVVGRLSSPFGMRVHPITGIYKLHTGQDISAPCGTPIKAARAGVVTDAGWNSAYGWRTVISHGVVDGVLLTTTYNHQPDLGVSVGQQVTTGQVIGRVGSTGYSTGCHLHFELYVNSSFVDPIPWLA